MTLEEISKVINQGKFVEANTILLSDYSGEKNDEYLAQLSLTYFLIGKKDEGIEIEKQISDPIYRGDVKRDYVLFMIRNKTKDSPEYISAQIEQVKILHEGDLNRTACLILIRARLELMLGNYKKSIACHKKALEGLTDGQWIMNCEFSLLRAYSAACMVTQASRLALRILKNKKEKDRIRKIRVILLMLPRIGYVLDDHMVSR